MNSEVFVAVKASSDGSEYFGIFSTFDLARAEADRHPGAFVVSVTLDKPTSF